MILNAATGPGPRSSRARSLGSYREAAFDIAIVGCAPRKAQRCLTHFPQQTEEQERQAGKGKAIPSNSPGMVGGESS